MTINAHPEIPEFDYVRPATLQEASQFLAQHSGESRPLSGGTDIFVRMRDGFWRDKFLVDVKNFTGAGDLRFDRVEGLTIGAGVNMNRVLASPEVKAHYPVLAEACRSVASYQLRTRATVVGNICNASPAGDTIGACLLYDGILSVHGLDGFRLEPLSGFFVGPGKTILSPGDIVTALHLPLPPDGCTGSYLKLGRNTWSDLSIVGVAALGWRNPITVSGFSFRVALASVAPVPLEVDALRAYLSETPPGSEAFKQAAQLARQACHPIDDVRGSARYRQAMAGNLTEKALLKTWTNLEESVKNTGRVS